MAASGSLSRNRIRMRFSVHTGALQYLALAPGAGSKARREVRRRDEHYELDNHRTDHQACAQSQRTRRRLRNNCARAPIECLASLLSGRIASADRERRLGEWHLQEKDGHVEERWSGGGKQSVTWPQAVRPSP